MALFSFNFSFNFKLEVLREHRPPPNANIKTAEWFSQCKLAMQLWSESTIRYFFDDPGNPDFGLRTPGSGRWSGSSPEFTPLVRPWALQVPYPSKKFRQNPFTTFSVIRRTDRQTDRSENITSFFGGGNNALHNLRVTFTDFMAPARTPPVSKCRCYDVLGRSTVKR